MTFGGKDNRGPSIAELQRYIRAKERLVFMLSNGKEIEGVLRWFDESAFQLVPDGQQPFTILRSAVVGYRRLSESGMKEAAAHQSAQPVKAAAAVAASEPAAGSGPDSPSEPSSGISADDIGGN